MLGTDCRRDNADLADEREWVTAVVGFGGLLSGACVLRCGGTAACALAERMMGTPFAEIDGTVKDAAAMTASSEPESVTAVVGFGGLLSGACVFRCGASAAMKVAARMTGMEFHAIDETVKDGIGEICNMLAGAWKGKVPHLAAHCGLSVPAVITGRDYNLHVQAPEFRLQHIYVFDGTRFEVTILCDGLK